MRRGALLTFLGLQLFLFCTAQKEKDPLALDSTYTDYEELFSELEHLIDSLTSPRNLTLINVSFAQNFLTYERSYFSTETKRQLTYSPSISHYHKSGFGVGAGCSIVNDGEGLNPYQFSLTGSYDYQKPKTLVTGVAFSHYFTKRELPFYSSPLQNEVYGYFTFRKWWVKPSMALSYGWGNREAFEEVEERIQNINLAQKGFSRINTTEKLIDLNLLVSLRHDFYFLDAWSSDYIRLTPQVSFTSGSQQFGFNQTTSTYATVRRSNINILYNIENVAFDNNFYFQPISLTTFLKAEYAKGAVFFQPQLMLDYYLPAASNRLTVGFIVNAGLAF